MSEALQEGLTSRWRNVSSILWDGICIHEAIFGKHSLLHYLLTSLLLSIISMYSLPFILLSFHIDLLVFFFSLNMTNFSKSLFLCIWGFLHPVNTQVKTFLCFQFKFNCSLSVEPHPGPEVNDTLPEAPIYVMDVSIVLCCLLDFLSSPDCGQLKGMEQALFIFLRIPLILSWMLNI